jgi:hypothetical protein
MIQNQLEVKQQLILNLKSIKVPIRFISHEPSHAAYQEHNNFIGSIKQLLNNGRLPHTID